MRHVSARIAESRAEQISFCFVLSCSSKVISKRSDAKKHLVEVHKHPESHSYNESSDILPKPLKLED